MIGRLLLPVFVFFVNPPTLKYSTDNSRNSRAITTSRHLISHEACRLLDVSKHCVVLSDSAQA